MTIFLLSCAFLAGMVVTALIFAWDARIKNRQKEPVSSWHHTIAPWPAPGTGPFTVEVQGKRYRMEEL